MSTSKRMIRTGVIAVLTLFTLAGMAFFYVANLRTNLIDELKVNLREIARSTTSTIEIRINENLKVLGNLSAMLENEGSASKEELIAALDKAYEQSDYLRFGIADKNGDCYTSDRVSFNVADRSYFKAAMKGEASFSDSLEDKLAGYLLNVYAVPVYEGDNITHVLFASSKTDDVAHDLLSEIYNGQGFTAIGDREGNIILNSISTHADLKITTLADISFMDDFDLQELMDGKSGVTRFRNSKKEERFMAYEPLGINNWYVYSVIPVSVVSSRINSFLTLATITWIIIALLFSAIIFYMYLSRAKSDHRIEKVIFYDELISHYNYNKFRMYVENILDSGQGEDYTMIEFDVSDFKMFNELYGYQGGDALLKTAMNVCDESCGNQEYCARIVADRFILFWKTQKQEEIVLRYVWLSEEIKKRMKSIFEQFKVDFYAGFYMLDKEEREFSRCHDRCMYAKNRIKKDKVQPYAFFSEDMYERILFDKKLESLMETALLDEEFKVYLQPKVRLSDESVVGAEALVRWVSPIYGMISPGNFIPLFESNGFLEQLDMYMLDHVCSIFERWDKQGMGIQRISFNVSRMYIFRPGFAKKIYDIVKKHGVNPACIEVEITENVIFDRSEELVEIIHELHDYGFIISMDDFGSGYSSLNMLKDIDIDVIKLDQVFFQTNFGNQVRANEIVAGMIRMAKTLDIEIVAEGIEKEEEVHFLRSVGCDQIQGYYYAKPLPLSEFEAYAQQNHKK